MANKTEIREYAILLFDKDDQLGWFMNGYKVANYSFFEEIEFGLSTSIIPCSDGESIPDREIPYGISEIPLGKEIVL